MIGIAVIVLALGALVHLAYRGISLLLLAPAMALLAVTAAEGGPVQARFGPRRRGSMLRRSFTGPAIRCDRLGRLA